MIDIHNHILFGVDDGPADLELSATMARIAHEDGIRTIVATPHFNHTWRVEKETVERKVAELQAELDRLGVPLSIVCGNEVRIEGAGFVLEALAKGRFCFLANNPAFVLMEEPWEGFHPDTWDVLETMRGRGTTIVLAHPERHPFFRNEPKLLERMIATGAVWTQVSVGSLLGENGPDAQAYAERLVDGGLAHTLATDAHNLRRQPVLSPGFDIVSARAGAKAAEAIRERMARIPANDVAAERKRSS